MPRHIAAETGSYAAVYRVQTSTVCGHERCFNLGNFQIECVRHYGTTMNAARRPPMDMATFATHDHGYISFPDIDASPSLVLSILAAGRAETDYDMKFFTGWGNIIILPLSFFLSFSS